MMITKSDDYFAKGCGRCPRFDTTECSTKRWSDGLAALRAICQARGLTETAKWGHPCYMWGDRNIALIGAFRDDFRLNFMNASLMTDPQSVLEKRGPNTRHADMLRFTDIAQVQAMEPVLVAYLQEAISYARDRTMPIRQTYESELPPELIDALDTDPEFSQAYHALTPGRQRSYVLHLSTTENPTTRIVRIGKFRGKVLTGKGWNERWRGATSGRLRDGGFGLAQSVSGPSISCYALERCTYLAERSATLILSSAESSTSTR